MASGLPATLPDDCVNTIEVNEQSVRLGELTWVMSDAVAMAFNALPEHEKNYRLDLLRHLMDSATAVLSCATVVPDAEAAEALCQGLDTTSHQALRLMLRMTIMA